MNTRAVLWAAAGLALFLTALVLLSGLGFRTFSVMTPSMGTTAPVGSLVLTHPAQSYDSGDVIAFTRADRVYTHRIVDANPVVVQTKGDLNGSVDPWTVMTEDVIGRAVWIAPGLGWVMLGLPWLVLGFAVVIVLSLMFTLPRHWRWVIRISGCTLVVCAVAFWLHPWIHLEMLSYTPADDEGVMMHVVNTGLFPLDANGSVIKSGQDAIIHVTEQNAKGYFILVPEAALTLAQRFLLFVICLLPLASSFLVRPETVGTMPGSDVIAAQQSRPSRRRIMLVLGIVVAVVLSVGFVNQSMAYGALTARVQNVANAAGGRTFFTCRSAVASLGANGTYVAYALGTGRGTNSDELDLSGNGRSGRYRVASTTSSSVGCLRDTPAASVTFNGTSQCLYIYQGAAGSGYRPNTFSLEAWFRTGTKSNGKIIGFGSSSNTAVDGSYDRHIYLDKDGRVVFGVYPSAVRIVTTPAGINYADNAWHHVVATLSPAGQSLYVDGALAMSNPAVTTAEQVHGYWKVGCGTLSGWENAAGGGYDGPSYFTGQIQYAAVHTSVLSAAQVKEHFLAGSS